MSHAETHIPYLEQNPFVLVYNYVTICFLQGVHFVAELIRMYRRLGEDVDAHVYQIWMYLLDVTVVKLPGMAVEAWDNLVRIQFKEPKHKDVRDALNAKVRV